MPLFPIEILAQGPAGIDAAERPFRRARFGGEAAIADMLRCRLKRGHQAAQEDLVVDGGAGDAAIHHNALDRVRKERCPVVGLQGPHRPAVDAGNAVDAEQRRQRPPLHRYVVVDRYQRGVVRRVGGRRRQPIAEHVGDDDEPPRGVEHAVGADEPLQVRMLRAVAGGVDDDVVLRRRHCAVGFPRQPSAAQDGTGLEGDVAGLENALLGGPGRHRASFRVTESRSRARSLSRPMRRCRWGSRLLLPPGARIWR